jgi:hypothetical protein
MLIARIDRKGKPCGKSYIPQNHRCNPQKKSLSPQEVERIVAREEEKIRDQPYESAVIIDSETGEILTKISGQQKSVDIEGKDLKNIRNNVITHNHPTASIVRSLPENCEAVKGSSFSLQDINTASYFGAKEIRATSSGYTYSMKPPKNRQWDKKYYDQVIEPTYQETSRKYRQLFFQKALNGEVRLSREGYLLDYDIYHLIWNDVAQSTGLQYQRHHTGGNNVVQNIRKQRSQSTGRRDSIYDILHIDTNTLERNLKHGKGKCPPNEGWVQPKKGKGFCRVLPKGSLKQEDEAFDLPPQENPPQPDFSKVKKNNIAPIVMTAIAGGAIAGGIYYATNGKRKTEDELKKDYIDNMAKGSKIAKMEASRVDLSKSLEGYEDLEANPEKPIIVALSGIRPEADNYHRNIVKKAMGDEFNVVAPKGLAENVVNVDILKKRFWDIKKSRQNMIAGQEISEDALTTVAHIVNIREKYPKAQLTISGHSLGTMTANQSQLMLKQLGYDDINVVNVAAVGVGYEPLDKKDNVSLNHRNDQVLERFPKENKAFNKIPLTSSYEGDSQGFNHNPIEWNKPNSMSFNLFRDHVNGKYRQDALLPLGDTKLKQTLTKLFTKSMGTAIKSVGNIIINQQNITGRAVLMNNVVVDFEVNPQQDLLKYRINKGQTPIQALRGDAKAYQRTKTKAKCKKGISCGKICISPNRSCRLKLKGLLSPNEYQYFSKLTTGEEGVTDPTVQNNQPQQKRYEDMTIRELQEVARGQGVYRTNHRSKNELIDILNIIEKQSPKQEEALRKTFNKRENNIYNGAPILTAEVREKQKRGRAIGKVVGSIIPGADKIFNAFTKASTIEDKAIASAIATSVLLGVGLIAYKNMETNYEKGLRESQIEAEKLQREELSKIDSEDDIEEAPTNFTPAELLSIINDKRDTPITEKEIQETFDELHHLSNKKLINLPFGSQPVTKNGNPAYTPYQSWLISQYYDLLDGDPRTVQEMESNGKLIDKTFQIPGKGIKKHKYTEAHRRIENEPKSFNKEAFKELDNTTYIVGGTGSNVNEMESTLKSYSVFNTGGRRQFGINRFRTFNTGKDGSVNATTVDGFAQIMYEGYGSTLKRSLNMGLPDTPLINARPRNQEAIRLAAKLYARGQVGGTINVVAAGEGGLVTREALEILRLMPTGNGEINGNDIASAVRFVSLGTPNLGPMGKTVVETNFVGDRDPIAKLKKKSATTVNGINTHDGNDYLKNREVMSTINDLLTSSKIVYKRGRRR